MNQDGWWEVEVDPNDPTKVVWRKLTDPEEIKAKNLEWVEAALAPLIALHGVPQTLAETAGRLIEAVEQIEDPKTEARRRSRQDVQRKRRELRRGRQ